MDAYLKSLYIYIYIYIYTNKKKQGLSLLFSVEEQIMLSFLNYVQKQQPIKFSRTELQSLIISHRHFDSCLSKPLSKSVVMGAVTVQSGGGAAAFLIEREACTSAVAAGLHRPYIPLLTQVKGMFWEFLIPPNIAGTTEVSHLILTV